MFKPKLSTLNISVTTSKPPAFTNPHLLLHQSRIVGEVGIRGGDDDIGYAVLWRCPWSVPMVGVSAPGDGLDVKREQRLTSGS
jgi:hypothetical protein